MIGSGNAEATGRILFSSADAVISDESGVEAALARSADIDGAVLISASGGKHAISVAEKLKVHGLSAVLFTNNPDAPSAEYFSEENVRVFPKNREPYTYNTSTYLGMILKDTGERADEIRTFIDVALATRTHDDFESFSSYVFILPTEFEALRPMISTKFDELFGPKVNGRCFTTEEIKHAKTVVSDDRELFISIGTKNETFGGEGNRLHIPLPEGAGYASAMAVCYFVVGLIQRSHPPYFKDNIEKYCSEASKVFGHDIRPIVE